MKNLLAMALVLISLTGCMSQPETRVSTEDTRPQIEIKGAPANSYLLVDNLKMGKANHFNGDPKTLRLEPGVHVIRIVTESGQTIHKQKIFLQSELKTITLTGY